MNSEVNWRRMAGLSSPGQVWRSKAGEMEQLRNCGMEAGCAEGRSPPITHLFNKEEPAPPTTHKPTFLSLAAGEEKFGFVLLDLPRHCWWLGAAFHSSFPLAFIWFALLISSTRNSNSFHSKDSFHSQTNSPPIDFTNSISSSMALARSLNLLSNPSIPFVSLLIPLNSIKIPQIPLIDLTKIDWRSIKYCYNINLIQFH